MKKRGPKPKKPADKMESKCIALLPRHIEKAEKKGNGNLSSGVRALIDSVDEHELRPTNKTGKPP